jgi:hypothetical protein
VLGPEVEDTDGHLAEVGAGRVEESLARAPAAAVRVRSTAFDVQALDEQQALRPQAAKFGVLERFAPPDAVQVGGELLAPDVGGDD